MFHHRKLCPILYVAEDGAHDPTRAAGLLYAGT